MKPVRRRFRRPRTACKQLNRFKRKPLTTRTVAEANRGATWADKEVKALLTIWGDSKIQEELDGAVRNKVVFERIAKKLQEQGYEREWKQCRAKVKNLKTKYREVKDNNDKTGRESHANSIGSLTKSLGIAQLLCLQLFLIWEISPLHSCNQKL